MIQIRPQLTKHEAVDIVKYPANAFLQIVLDEIADGHMAGRLLLVQHPEKTYICFAQLLNW